MVATMARGLLSLVLWLSPATAMDTEDTEAIMEDTTAATMEVTTARGLLVTMVVTMAAMDMVTVTAMVMESDLTCQLLKVPMFPRPTQSCGLS